MRFIFIFDEDEDGLSLTGVGYGGHRSVDQLEVSQPM